METAHSDMKKTSGAEKKHKRNNWIFATIVLAAILIIVVVSNRPAISDSGDMTVMLTGDLMCDWKYQRDVQTAQGGFDFDDTFRYVKPLFEEVDFVVGNLETCVSESHPISIDQHTLNGKPYTNAPEEWLESLKKAGFDGVVMANNHMLDTSREGIVETIDAVEESGLLHSGLYKDKDDDHYFILEKDGIQVAVVSYAHYINQPVDCLTEEEQDYMLSLIDRKEISDDVSDARAAGADYIIGYVHRGRENTYEVSDNQKKAVQLMADCGVDYVVCSHPHLLQQTGEVERDNTEIRVPYVYSMGNFTGNLTNPLTRETAILKLTISADDSGKAILKDTEFIPCYMEEKWGSDNLVLIPEGQRCWNHTVRHDLDEHYANVREILQIEKP